MAEVAENSITMGRQYYRLDREEPVEITSNLNMTANRWIQLTQYVSKHVRLNHSHLQLPQDKASAQYQMCGHTTDFCHRNFYAVSNKVPGVTLCSLRWNKVAAIQWTDTNCMAINIIALLTENSLIVRNS